MLVKEAFIASTNDRNEFCKPVLKRNSPFRSASTDAGQNWGRCNIDFQFMPRTLDPDQVFGDSAAQPAESHLNGDSAAQPAVLQVNPKDALAMYGVRRKMPSSPLLRRCFHSLVAMFQAAHNCDFYITKYQAKPMQQLQSLLTNIASALRRLEQEEELAQASRPPEAGPKEPAERARQTTLKIANAANRSSWCSCCEMATFIKTGALARKTHRPIAIFLSRPMFLYEECRRILQRSNEILIDAPSINDDEARTVDVLSFTINKADAETLPNEAEANSDGKNSDADSVASLSGRSSISASEDEEADGADSVAQPAAAVADSVAQPATDGADSVAQPAADRVTDAAADSLSSVVQPDADVSEEDVAEDEAYQVAALESTTSAHDDWLHRGPHLFALDWHTYMRFTVRKPRPKKIGVRDLVARPYSIPGGASQRRGGLGSGVLYRTLSDRVSCQSPMTLIVMGFGIGTVTSVQNSDAIWMGRPVGECHREGDDQFVNLRGGCQFDRGMSVSPRTKMYDYQNKKLV